MRETGWRAASGGLVYMPVVGVVNINRILDDLKDAANRKIIVADRRGVCRVAAQLTGGGFKRIQAMTESFERL
jgi:hypothetical protein